MVTWRKPAKSGGPITQKCFEARVSGARIRTMAVRTNLKLGFVILALSGPLPAFAQDQATLICTNAGISYKVGEYACIAACHGQRRLARCDAAAQTVASWTYVSDVCPSAMIKAPWPTDWTELPASTRMSPIPVTVNMSAPAPDMTALIESYGTHRIVFH
jgi:hypothetical protein